MPGVAGAGRGTDEVSAEAVREDSERAGARLAPTESSTKRNHGGGHGGGSGHWHSIEGSKGGAADSWAEDVPSAHTVSRRVTDVITG